MSSSALPKFIKLCCGKNTRKIKLPSCFDELVLESIRIFPELKSLSKNNELIFFYIDDEKQIIQIASKEDYEIAMQSDPVPTRLYTGSQVSDVTQSILESEKVRQKLRVSSMIGEGVPPLSFRQENSYYQGSECSKVVDDARDIDELSSFSLVGHSDARVNAAELMRMQNQNKVERKPSSESDKEIQDLRDQMKELKVSEPEDIKKDDKVGVDFNQNTEVKELINTSVNTSAKIMSQVAMQSIGVEQSDKMCQQKPDLIPIALDAIPPVASVDKASSPSHHDAEQVNFEAKQKKKGEKKKKKKITKEKVLRIIEEEIKSRVPVIFKQLFDTETEKRKGNYRQDMSSQAIHKDIICDECGADPIVGVRYKSIIQKNYDLCSRCEATIEHPHAMLKISKPELAPASLIVYKQEHDLPVNDENFKNQDDGKGFKRFDIDVRGAKNQEVDRIRKMSNAEEVKKQESKPIVAPALDSSKQSIGGAWGRTGCKKNHKIYKCRYVKEYPDGDQPLSPGQHFAKTFTLRNDGQEAWPQTTQLCNVGGDYLGFVSQNIGVVLPGKQIDVDLHLVAPQEQGRFTGYLRMCEKHGEARFGHRFWCTALVRKDIPVYKQLPKKGIEEEKAEDDKAEVAIPLESAFSEYVEKFPDQPQSSLIEKDYRFALLPKSVQDQVLNLCQMGLNTDVDKIFGLIEKHSKNIDKVANEIFQSNVE